MLSSKESESEGESSHEMKMKSNSQISSIKFKSNPSDIIRLDLSEALSKVNQKSRQHNGAEPSLGKKGTRSVNPLDSGSSNKHSAHTVEKDLPERIAISVPQGNGSIHSSVNTSVRLSRNQMKKIQKENLRIGCENMQVLESGQSIVRRCNTRRVGEDSHLRHSESTGGTVNISADKALSERGIDWNRLLEQIIEKEHNEEKEVNGASLPLHQEPTLVQQSS